MHMSYIKEYKYTHKYTYKVYLSNLKELHSDAEF